MRQIVQVLSWYLIGLLALLSLPAAPGDNAFRVVVSIKPIHSIVAGLMEGTEGPELLIDGDRTPFAFDLTPEQRASLNSADLVIWVGAELENALGPALNEIGSEVRVVELLSSPSMKVLPSRFDDRRRDPYLWMDNRNAILLIDELTRLLQDLDPSRAHLYMRNRRQLLQRLSLLDRELEYGYRGLKAGSAVQYYDTLQYFEQAYALPVIDHVAASPEHAVDAASLLKVRGLIGRGEAVCLLTDVGLEMKHLSVITQGLSPRLAELDLLGRQWDAGPDLYFRLMRHTSDKIKECLNMDNQESEVVPGPTRSAAGAYVEGIGDGRFMLSDQYGRLVTEQSMRGKYQLIYFGYTYCPDICPNTLQIVSLALDQLGDAARQIQPYFITVDPQRDSVQVMRNYVDYFDPRLIGLTGSKSMIENMTRQFKVRYEKVASESGDPALYLMDHTASLYLMAPDGSFITKFAYGLSAEQLARELTDILP